MESGKRAACNGHEQHGEQVISLCSKCIHGCGVNKHRCGYGRLAVCAQNEDANKSAGDHDEHQDNGQEVAWLLDRLNGKRRSQEQVHHDNGEPGVLIKIDRHSTANCERNGNQHERKQILLYASKAELAIGPSEQHGSHGQHDRDAACCTACVRFCGIERAVGHHSRKRSGNHRSERRDNNDAKQPAEQQEQAAARFANVLLNELSKGFSVVLDRGIQCAEIVHSAKENAANKNPQHNRKPTEHHCHDGTRHGACTAD